MPTTSRDPDRLVLFTDAVVAIAITLLVLPLVDLANEPVRQASEVITENWPQIGSFALSFAVIARLWLTHHRMFQHVRAYTRTLVLGNMMWVFTTVVLPFPTELVGRYGDDPFTVAFYIGTILASSLCQLALILIIHRHPEIQEQDNRLQVRHVISAIVTTALIVVALLVAMFVPSVTYYALLLLLLSPFVVRVFARTPATTQVV